MKLRWHWGTKIALVYVVFAGSTLGFVAYAMHQDVDLVSPAYYEESLAYDARQAAAARGLALGTSVVITPNAADQTIGIEWPAAAKPASGRVRLYRASNSAADRTIDLDVSRIDDSGRLVVSVDRLASGSWIAQLQWTVGGIEYYVERRLVIP